MPETQPDLSHRAEVLLNFWFASESASKVILRWEPS
jgi:hypothetical protein